MFWRKLKQKIIYAPPYDMSLTRRAIDIWVQREWVTTLTTDLNEPRPERVLPKIKWCTWTWKWLLPWCVNASYKILVETLFRRKIPERLKKQETCKRQNGDLILFWSKVFYLFPHVYAIRIPIEVGLIRFWQGNVANCGLNEKVLVEEDNEYSRERITTRRRRRIREGRKE